MEGAGGGSEKNTKIQTPCRFFTKKSPAPILGEVALKYFPHFPYKQDYQMWTPKKYRERPFLTPNRGIYLIGIIFRGDYMLRISRIF